MTDPIPETANIQPLTVLNHGGRDAAQAFPNRAGSPDDPGHAPVNFHAYAACTAGFFEDNLHKAIERGTPILLLLRRDLRPCLKALEQLKNAGATVAVTFKETGIYQVSEALAASGQLPLLRRILALADGAIAATPWLVNFFKSLVPTGRTFPVDFIPTPYPVTESAWDFSRPWEERAGIFVGTREFFTPSRCHLTALVTLVPLVENGVPVTVCNFDKGRGRRLLKEIFGGSPANLRIVETRSSYPQYLQMLAEHRLVFQMDRSAVPGQVAGDCLLTRTPCLGGDGMIETLTFSHLSSSTEEIQSTIRQLITDEHANSQAIDQALSLARQHVSFDVVAPRLTQFFSELSTVR